MLETQQASRKLVSHIFIAIKRVGIDALVEIREVSETRARNHEVETGEVLEAQARDPEIETREVLDAAAQDPEVETREGSEAEAQDSEVEVKFDHLIWKLKLSLPRLKDFENSISTME